MLKLLLTTALILSSFSATRADDPPPPPPVVPPRVQIQPLPAVQPGLGVRVTAVTMARYEEEAEVLSAQLDVKKAYIKVAEVTLVGAKQKLDRSIKLEERRAITPDEVAVAKIELDTAEAMLDIRKAEAKEVEVKVKYAKKRLESAKVGGVRGPVARPAGPQPLDPR